MSEQAFNKKYPTGKIPKRSGDYGKAFICRRGCNTRTATYTDEFAWEDVQHGDEEEVADLIGRMELDTRSTRKRKYQKRTKKGDDDFTGGRVIDEDMEMQTPRKKQKFSSVTSTPRKPRTPSKLLTPSHKRCGFLISDR